MNQMFFNTCTISRREKSGSDDGTPTFTDTPVSENVPCRLDPMHSRLRPSNTMSEKASFVEHIYATLFLAKDVEIDETCFVVVAGDSRTYEVLTVNKVPGFGGINHIECDVRTVGHR